MTKVKPVWRKREHAFNLHHIAEGHDTGQMPSVTYFSVTVSAAAVLPSTIGTALASPAKMPIESKRAVPGTHRHGISGWHTRIDAAESRSAVPGCAGP